jgi:hypothetical protein
MANGLPMMDPMMAGNAGIERMPPADSMGGMPPIANQEDEVAQLLFLRDQIDQRLAEITGGAGAPMPAPQPMGQPGPVAQPGPMAQPGLLGAGPY